MDFRSGYRVGEDYGGGSNFLPGRSLPVAALSAHGNKNSVHFTQPLTSALAEASPEVNNDVP